VAHHHEGAGPVLEEVLQHPQGVDVEVVGGLVEQQHVGTPGQHQQQLEAAALAAREGADLGPLGVGVEPEALEQPALLGPGHPGGAGHGLADPLVRVELGAGLVVVAHPHGGAVLDPPLGRGQPAGDQVEQGGLAGAVGPHHAEALVGGEQQVEPTEEQRPRAVAVAGAVELDDLVAEAGRAEVEVELARAGRGLGPALDQRGGRRDPGLGLAGAGRGAPSQPGQLATGQVAPGRLGTRGLLLALGPGLEVGAVAALVHVGVAPVELEDAGGDPVEHMAVVGDEHEPAPVAGQPVLEPGDAVDVEVVGRLVEHQQVEGVHEEAGQGDPLPLTPGERRHVGAAEGTQPEPLEHGVDLPVGAPDGVEAGCRRRPDGARRELGALLEHAHPHPPALADGALLGLVDAGQDPQQGGLAGAVEPHHPQTVAGGQGQRELTEEGPAGPAGAHPVEVDEDHGSPPYGDGWEK
jgi:hypothetical protein